MTQSENQQKYGFEEDQELIKNTAHKLSEIFKPLVNNAKWVSNALAQIHEGNSVGFNIDYPGMGAQLVYERFLNLIELIDTTLNNVTDEEVRKKYDQHKRYIQHRISTFEKRTDVLPGEKFFTDLWKDPKAKESPKELLRRKYLSTAGYFEMANKYYHNRKDGQGWQYVFERINKEHESLGIPTRHKSFDVFKSARSRHVNKKTDLS